MAVADGPWRVASSLADIGAYLPGFAKCARPPDEPVEEDGRSRFDGCGLLKGPVGPELLMCMMEAERVAELHGVDLSEHLAQLLDCS